MINDKFNKSLLTSLEGSVKDEYLELFKIHSNKIIFIQSLSDWRRDVFCIRAEQVEESILNGNTLSLDFVKKEGLSDSELIDLINDTKVKGDIYLALKEFLETEDRILYVLVEQDNLINSKKFEVLDKIVENGKISEINKIDKIFRFEDEYIKNSLRCAEDAAYVDDVVKNRVRDSLTYEDAVKLKELILKDECITYEQEASNKELCLLINSIIIENELANIPKL